MNPYYNHEEESAAAQKANENVDLDTNINGMGEVNEDVIDPTEPSLAETISPNPFDYVNFGKETNEDEDEEDSEVDESGKRKVIQGL